MGAQDMNDKAARQEEKRALVLKTARELIAKEGMAALNASRIAKELGWKTPGLYYYFKNLEAIKEGLILELAKETVAISLEPAKKAKSGSEALLVAFRARVEYYAAHPEDFHLPWHHLIHSGIREESLKGVIYRAAEELNGWLEERLEKDRAQGLIAQDVDSRKLINLMICLAQGICSMYLSIEAAGGRMRYPIEEMIEEGERTLALALKG